MAFEVGQRVGDYEVVKLLGVGGMGSVYRVRNVISDRTEAMKVLLPDLTAERDLAIRFIAEIRTLAGFDHPNIALLHTAFQADNQLIMMMEFVEGLTLEQRAKQGAIAIPEVCEYVYQALSALSYAHGRGVVHRDIKPANLMLTSHGIVKLMDFGIAKSAIDTNLTMPGTTIGSLYYMSPEQVRGELVDARSDLYSVGIMLYELLAGRRPFEADTTFSILNQQLNSPPQPPIDFNPALPRALNDVILHALAKSPAERYQSADHFRDALRPFCSNQSTEPGYIATTPSSFSSPAAAVTIPQTAHIEAPPPPIPGLPVSYPPATSSPPPRVAKNGNKAIWIGTGIAAALLAMVGLAIGLPRVLGTKAAESETITSRTAADRPTFVASAAEPPADDSAHASAGSISLQGQNPLGYLAARDQQPGGPAITQAKPSLGSGSPVGTSRRQPYTGAGSLGNMESTRATGSVPNSPELSTGSSSSPSSSGLEQEQDRFADVSARAGAVNSSISRMRHEQEAMGVGLRGDIESADNRMESYLRSADQDLRGGNAASAAKNINRAEGELATIEKFLGR